MTQPVPGATPTETAGDRKRPFNVDARWVLLVSSAFALWLIAVVWPADLSLGGTGYLTIWRGVFWLIAAALTFLAWQYRKAKLARGLFIVSAIFLWVIATILTGELGGGSEVRFATAVGGLTILFLLLGLHLFDTVRAAASLAVVMLTVGVLTFPGGAEIVGTENLGTIITWFGIVLGVNGAAEAAVQVAASRGGAAAESAKEAGDARGL